MKQRIIVSLLLFFYTNIIYAQGNLILKNTTTCDMYVVMQASDYSVSLTCGAYISNQTLVPASTTIGPLNPCSFTPGWSTSPGPISGCPTVPSSFYWEYADVRFVNCSSPYADPPFANNVSGTYSSCGSGSASVYYGSAYGMYAYFINLPFPTTSPYDVQIDGY